jgi:hypothetical protein
MANERHNLERLLQSAYDLQQHPKMVLPQVSSPKDTAASKTGIITRDVFLAVVTLLIPQGWSMSGFPPNIVLACVCWLGAAIFLADALWTYRSLGKWTRATAILVGMVTTISFLWIPVKVEYTKEHPRLVQVSPKPEPAPTVVPPAVVPQSKCANPAAIFHGGEISGGTVVGVWNDGTCSEFDGTKIKDNGVNVLNTQPIDPEAALARLAEEQQKKKKDKTKPRPVPSQ